MKSTNDLVDTSLAALATATLASAPAPPALSVIRILADRRRSEARARRLSLLLALASAVPPLIALAAWHLRPPDGGPALLGVILVAWGVPALSICLSALTAGRGRYETPG